MALYDRIGRGYVAVRQPDPRLAAVVWKGLGEARTVVNVGAGAGSYEPTDREVVAVEPSAREPVAVSADGSQVAAGSPNATIGAIAQGALFRTH